MELWDVYDENKNKIGKTVERGNNLIDGEYHLVVNAWIMNDNGEFLITQRAPNKTYAYMWECTGGSALMGESSLEAAMREVKEETGICVDGSTANLIGSTKRYYTGCSDILDVWIFKSNFTIDEVRIQYEEVCDAKWATSDEIRKMIEDNKFSANAFCDVALEYSKD